MAISGTFVALWVCLLVMFALSEAASESPHNITTEGLIHQVKVVTLKFTTVNHINYDGALGECRVRCEAHDSTGVFTMGVIDLRNGQEQTWTKLVDSSGPDFIHCEFVWTSQDKRIDYNVYSGEHGHIQPVLSGWSVTEFGLFERLLSGKYSQVIGWSG